MDKTMPLNQGHVVARYKEQRIPQFRGNPLIEALPPSMEDDELMQALLYKPEYDPNQRLWPAHERLQMLGSLANFMVPLMRHIDLARSLDSMLRNGYVGRAPRTAEHVEIFQRIYENQMAGVPFRQACNSRSPQISTSLIGISGMGKTSTVTRWLAHIPQVIYHRELKIYQIPYLHIETPSDGSSIRGLAHAILHRIDELIPGSNYYQKYAVKGRPGDDALMRNVARVLNMHLVGLLICDEVQNLSVNRKGSDTLMNELVSACNALHIPILFIGTNKASNVLGKEFRQARRSSGYGISPWDRFTKDNDDDQSEWRDFIEVLWGYQWTQKTAPFSDMFANVMYVHSQGVIDIAIKLFVSAQARAIADGSEEISVEHLDEVYRNELRLLQPMVEALRKNDLEALVNFDDIAPIGLSDILDGIGRKLRAKKSPLHNVRPGDETFVPRVAASLTAIGISEEDALAAGTAVEAKGTASTLADATKQALALVRAPKRPSRSKKNAEVPANVIDFSARPNDYRRAVQAAKTAGTSTYKQLRVMGMAVDLEDILALG